MGMERIKAKFPSGIIREKHPFYMADAIRDIPACLAACLADGVFVPLQQALDGFQPDRIFAVGCGTSYNACQAIAYTCQTLLGIPALACDAYDFELDMPPGVDSRALVVSVSQSGQSLTTCLAQELAGKQGARTVGISGNPDSRLAKNARIPLTDPFGLEIPLGKTRSYLSSALLGTLAGMLTAAPGARDEFILQARQTVSALSTYMEKWEAKAQAIAAEWAGRTSHYLLTGFGVHKATADEIGLKLIEVISESATSFSLEEFTHGVNASFHNDMGIFLFQTDPRTLEKAVRIANGIALSAAPLVVITDRADAGWPEKASKVELPPLSYGGQLGLYPAAIAAQYLMYFLAIAKGMNPDINGNDIHPELGDIYTYFFPPGTH